MYDAASIRDAGADDKQEILYIFEVSALNPFQWQLY